MFSETDSELPGIVVAGTSSSVGKTTVSLALMKAFENRGFDVQPYKVGPDYIDPSHHKEVTETASRTLDVHMMGEEGVRDNYVRGEGDIGVVEGVMGMYDSYEESTAKVAEILGLPVVLVVDASAGMESVAATALGFNEYSDKCTDSSGVDIAGVIANKASSEKHLEGISNGLEKAGIELLGNVPRILGLEIPSRHLGLHMAEEEGLDEEYLNEATNTIDITRIRELVRKPRELERSRDSFSQDPKTQKTVAVARDPAFSFYYPRNIEELSRKAEIKYFSPITDTLPDADAYYFGGGYPELHAEELEGNSNTRRNLRQKAESGTPIFGECGGFMYLSESLKVDGEEYDMAGVLPVEIEMTDSLQAIGYSEIRGEEGFISETDVLRGHEFHYSRATLDRDAKTVFDVVRGNGVDGDSDGVTEYSTVGSYTHLHAGSQKYFDYLLDL